jgi:hypothetical protein
MNLIKPDKQRYSKINAFPEIKNKREGACNNYYFAVKKMSSIFVVCI